MKPLRDKVIDMTGTDRGTVGYRTIQTVLTFGLVTFAWIFFRAPSLGAAVEMVMAIPFHFQSQYLVGSELFQLGLSAPQLCVLVVAIAVLVTVSILQEKGHIRPCLDRQPLPVRWAVYLVGIAVVLVFGCYGPEVDPGVFIYAQF